MPEIKLIDGTLIKTTETIAELRSKVIPAQKFMPVGCINSVTRPRPRIRG
jgi:hypothetical protein